MKKYLAKFENEAAYDEFKAGEDFVTPNVSWCVEEDSVKWNPIVPVPPQHDYSQDYFTIVSTSDNNVIEWKASDTSVAKTISVSTDEGSTWTDVTSTTGDTTLATLNTGDKLLIKGSNTAYATSSYYNYFTSSGQFNVEGNIMSLIYGDNFIGQTTLSETHIFKQLFYYNENVVDTSNIILPATTLTERCYDGMFRGCTSLTTAPELPATTLANYCYYSMFSHCASLTTAPELPATTLANYCYLYIFSDCTSLTTAPELPATTLASNCYESMFWNCTSLTTAPELPATTLAERCYSQMFRNCAALTTAPDLPATTLAQYCYNAMFQGCTSLVNAPTLPATTLVKSCYFGMFNGCTSLTTAPELPATTLAESCYFNMFSGCTQLNYIKCLATNISASSCLYNWVKNVQTTSGTFVKDPSMSSWTTGVNGIPSGWTVQDAS